MAGEVSFVAERCLATVTFVWLVTVDLKHVAFQRLLFCEFGVAFIAKICTIFYCGDEQQEKKREERSRKTEKERKQESSC